MDKLRAPFSLSSLAVLENLFQVKSIDKLKSFTDGVVSSHLVVQPSIDRIKLNSQVPSDSSGLAVDLISVEGLVLRTAEKAETGRVQVRIQLSLFDARYLQFFGRTWTGPLANFKEGGKVSYNQSVYMHTSLNDSQIYVVFEVVAVTQTEDGETHSVGCGWGVKKLFKADIGMADVSDNKAAPAKRIDLYNGSPRVLLHLTGDIEGNPNLVKAGSCQILCATQMHKVLLRVAHLFPENVFLGQQDNVPGLIGGPRDSKTGIPDNLRRPKMAKALQCSVERMTVRLNPSLDKFEEELCKQLLDEYMERELLKFSGKGIQVVRRYLRVGIHNGWNYVAQPEDIQLSLNSETVNLNKSGSFKRSQRSSVSTSTVGAATGLVHKGRTEIQGLLQDVAFHIVFTLVYEVTVPGPNAEDQFVKKTSLAQPVLGIVVRWGAVCPFSDSNATEQTVQLFGGPLTNPDSVFVYHGLPGSGTGSDPMESNLSAMSSTLLTGGSITFTLNMGAKDKENFGGGGGFNQIVMQQQQQQQQQGAFSSRSLNSLNVSEDGDLLHQAHLDPMAQMFMGGKLPSSKKSTTKAPGMHELQASQQGYPMMPQQQGYPNMPQQQGYPIMPQGVYGAGSTGYPIQQQGYGLPSQGYPIPMPTTELQELPYTPIHIPIMATIPGMHRGQSLSRAAYAKLHSVGFPPILDRKGGAAEVVDPSDNVSFIAAKEDCDRLKVNEITLQFMAFTQTSTFEVNARRPSTLFFTFQFYRFDQVTSERLILETMDGELSTDKSCLPFLLKRLDRDGTVLKGPPGYQVKYLVDPAFMREGESQLFAKYLAEQTMHIDVWDGDSLLPVGSCLIDLKHLCRQGREAVQVSYELEVIMTEYVEHEMIPTGDITSDGSTRPVDVNTIIRGRLHLRIGNVGRPLESKKLLKSKTLALMKSNRQIIGQEDLPTTLEESSKDVGTGFCETSASSCSMYKTKVCKAQHLAEVSHELAQLIHSRKLTGETTNDRTDPAEKMRKLARMEAVRQAECSEDTAPVTTIRKQKEERSRDLKTMELFRTHGKRENIMNMLNLAITTEHQINASLGTTEFFEYVLRNPYNTEITVSVEWDDLDLVVITNPSEWRHFKMINEVYTSIEEGMFNATAKSGHPELFLRPKESVNVPFKFLTFKGDHSVQPQTPTDPYKTISGLGMELKTREEKLQTRNIQVHFRCKDGKPVAILCIKVEQQPHIIDQTFRLSHPEHTFLKKSFRLPPLHSIADLPVGCQQVSQVFVRCSDPNVICDSRKIKPGEPLDIFIKVASGASPQVKRFFVAMYIDPYMSKPLQIWQLYIQAMQRVDAAATQGQTSRFSLVLRGTSSSRLVQCFSSHEAEMQIQPKDPFMLAANSLQEINIGVRPHKYGVMNMYVHVVDLEFHQLIRSWLVNVISQQPIVNKSFELVLPVGGGQGSNKKISFTNPYATRKIFYVRTSREDLVQFKEQKLDLGGAEKTDIGLRFTPAMAAGHVDILVFINDEDDKNEETFSIKAVYK